MGHCARGLMILSLVAAAGTPLAAAAKHSVTIAVEAPIFDWLSDTRLFAEAARMALDERGGTVCGDWSVNIEVHDYGHAKKFINDGRVRGNAHADVAREDVGAVLGPYNSSVAEMLLPILSPARLLVVSPSNTFACLTSSMYGCSPGELYPPNGVRNYARTIAHDGIGGARLADWASSILASTSERSVYLVHVAELYGDIIAGGFATQAPSAGVTLVGEESYSRDAPNFPAMAERILSADPAIVMLAVLGEGVELVRELCIQGYAGDLMVSDGLFGDWWLGEVAAECGEMRIYAALPGRAPESYDDPTVLDFGDDFAKHAGEPPSGYTAEAYLASHIILDAFDDACAAGHLPTDRDAVRAAALAPQTRTSKYFGDYSLDANGDQVAGPVSGYRVVDGTFVFQTLLY